MASGWNLWVWLQCIGVASWCCYKEVYRYPHNWGEPERAPHLSYSGEKSSSYIYIIGERSEPPLSVELSDFSLYLLYIYTGIYIFQALRRARDVNALRANVGPAG